MIFTKKIFLSVDKGWSYWQFKKFQDITTATSPATTESFYTEDGELEINKVRALSRSYAQAIAGNATYKTLWFFNYDAFSFDKQVNLYL